MPVLHSHPALTSHTSLNAQTPVGQWVALRPHTSRVFEHFHIDYCCGGGKSLEAACREQQLDLAEVIARLQESASTGSAETAVDWTQAPLTDLCDHVEQTHHAYLKTELPRLTELIAKVHRAHGSTHPELSTVQQVFSRFRGELMPHMFKEEQVLFPAIRRLSRDKASADFPFGSIANPIRMMEHEHDDAGDELASIRELTGDFAVPEGVCNTYRAMLEGLRGLEADMHQHVHKENSILFPRAIALEQSRASERS